MSFVIYLLTVLTLYHHATSSLVQHVFMGLFTRKNVINYSIRNNLLEPYHYIRNAPAWAVTINILLCCSCAEALNLLLQFLCQVWISDDLTMEWILKLVGQSFKSYLGNVLNALDDHCIVVQVNSCDDATHPLLIKQLNAKAVSQVFMSFNFKISSLISTTELFITLARVTRWCWNLTPMLGQISLIHHL